MSDGLTGLAVATVLHTAVWALVAFQAGVPLPFAAVMAVAATLAVLMAIVTMIEIVVSNLN